MNNKLLFAAPLTLAFLVGGCVAETPFSSADAEGQLRLSVSVNANYTRAIEDEEEQHLNESCIVLISNEKGTLHKFKGTSSIPAALPLKYGNYLAEAWAGDSVPASFDKRFFMATPQSFEIDGGEKALPLVCKIANAVVSLDPSRMAEESIKECSVEVSHSRGSLTFLSSEPSKRGYFMMPHFTNAEGKDEKESVLNYKVKGTTPLGQEFEKDGVIENVKPAYEYTIGFRVESVSPNEGGAFITIVIDEQPLEINHSVVIKGKPTITGEDFDIDDQIIGTPGNFSGANVKIAAFNGFSSIDLKFDKGLQDLGFPKEFDFTHTTASQETELDAKGISIAKDEYSAVTGLHRRMIHFSADFFNKLPESDTEYVIEFIVKDLNDDPNLCKTGTAQLCIANTKAAERLKAPAIPQTPPADAVSASSVVIPIEVNADADEIYAEYREKGETEWQRAEVTRAAASVTLSSLVSVTSYEMRVVGIISGKTLYSPVVEFKTSGYAIPGASFEEWSTYKRTGLGLKDVTLPGNTGDKSTSQWGSGNEGSAMASMVLTDKSTDMVHAGKYSARLETKEAVGVIAAGNIFIGEYVKTDGTDGVLSLGREYDGSKPTALKFWANYRPASKAEVKSGNEEYVPSGFKGGNDHGQVYVALTTEPYEIRTKASERKLMDKDDPTVVAYGEVTWTGNFGPNGALEAVEIPITYTSQGQGKAPKYLIIVASASKYGDFYSGAAGSVMYLDDFKLKY